MYCKYLHIPVYTSTCDTRVMTRDVRHVFFLLAADFTSYVQSGGSSASSFQTAGRRTTQRIPAIAQSEHFLLLEQEKRKPTPSSLHACVLVMNGKGVKRPLIRTAVSSPTGTCVSQPQPRGGRSGATSNGSPRNWTSSPTNPRSPPGRPYCCGCRRWNGSKLRLASIVGIHVLGLLGLMACPCRGFTAPSAAYGLFFSDGQRNADSECRSSAVDSDGGYGYGNAGDFRCWAEAGGNGEREWGTRGGRRRPRELISGRGGFAADAGVARTTCPATRLPSAEEGRPLGLLYDAALFKKNTSRNGGGNGGAGAGVVKGEAAESSSTSGVSGVSMSGESEASVETDLLERMSSVATEDPGDNLTARWANVVNGAMADTTTPMTTMTPPSRQQRRQQEQQQQQQKQKQRQDALTLESRPTTAPAVRKKWSGKGWVGIGASWRAGEGWSGWSGSRAKGPEAAAAATGADTPTTMSTSTSTPTSTSDSTSTPTSTSISTLTSATISTTTLVDTCLEDGVLAAVEVGRRYGGDGGGGDATVVAVPAPSNATNAQANVGPEETSGNIICVLSTLDRADRPSWRVWRGPGPGRAPGSAEEEELGATAREQLTLYLLQTGATHYDVAKAAEALFAVEPESALARATWRRWRQNLDGLRSTGFAGAWVSRDALRPSRGCQVCRTAVCSEAIVPCDSSAVCVYCGWCHHASFFCVSAQERLE